VRLALQLEYVEQHIAAGEEGNRDGIPESNHGVVVPIPCVSEGGVASYAGHHSRNP